MMYQKTMYFVFFILCFLISSRVVNSALLATVCDENSEFSEASVGGRLYLRNMVSLFSVLSSNASRPNGFYNYTAGAGTLGQPVNGLFLCRGDVTPNECQTCIKSAVAEILRSCSNVSRAATWFDNCMLRYSDLPIYSKLETLGGASLWEPEIVTDVALLNRTLAEVFTKITNEAANGKVPGKKFAVAEANFTAFSKIFALGQCTPDISSMDCDFCLRDAVTHYLPACCKNRASGYVLHPSCAIRYSTTPFFRALITPPPSLLLPPSSQPTATPESPPSLPGGVSTASVAGIVRPIATPFVAILVAFFVL